MNVEVSTVGITWINRDRQPLLKAEASFVIRRSAKPQSCRDEECCVVRVVTCLDAFSDKISVVYICRDLRRDMLCRVVTLLSFKFCTCHVVLYPPFFIIIHSRLVVVLRYKEDGAYL